MELDLNFIEPLDNRKAIKATIHKSGKLGFSSGAYESLKLENYKSIGIATNKSEDDNLYMILYEEHMNNAYRINKAGEYSYLSAKDLFDRLGIDYSDELKTIIYDIVDTNQKFENKTVYKLKRRVIINKNKMAKD